MSKTPVLSGKEVVRVLREIGYRQVRQSGSHIRLACMGRKSVTVPDHKEIGSGLLRKILRDIEISRRDFDKILNG